MRGYILQTGRKRAIMNPQAEPLPADAPKPGAPIRNPNYAERNVPICLLSRAPPNPAISWLFLGYFLVLFAERVQSLARICRTSFAALYRTGFDGFVDTLTVLSLVATVLLLAFGCRGYWQSLVNPAVIPDYSMLTVTAGVMLVSGMMHTEYTVAPVQFVSYGMLIIAMVLRTVQTAAGADHPGMFWYSLAFLTVFSMAIPSCIVRKLPMPRSFT